MQIDRSFECPIPVTLADLKPGDTCTLALSPTATIFVVMQAPDEKRAMGRGEPRLDTEEFSFLNAWNAMAGRVPLFSLDWSAMSWRAPTTQCWRVRSNVQATFAVEKLEKIR